MTGYVHFYPSPLSITAFVCFQLAVKGLITAQETFLRMNDQGMLVINHKIVGEDSRSCYVSFTIMPDMPDSEGEAY